MQLFHQLETDFNLQYTNAANRLIDLWPEFKVKLVGLLISSRGGENAEEFEDIESNYYLIAPCKFSIYKL